MDSRFRIPVSHWSLVFAKRIKRLHPEENQLLLFCGFFCVCLFLICTNILLLDISAQNGKKSVSFYADDIVVLFTCVFFPQAAVRAQKGEKGEPAVLEPVSY